MQSWFRKSCISEGTTPIKQNKTSSLCVLCIRGSLSSSQPVRYVIPWMGITDCASCLLRFQIHKGGFNSKSISPRSKSVVKDFAAPNPGSEYLNHWSQVRDLQNGFGGRTHHARNVRNKE